MHELSVQHNICNNFFELLPLFRLSKISTTHMLFYKKNSCNNEAIPPINLANRNSNSDARLEHRSSSKETVVHDRSKSRSCPSNVRCSRGRSRSSTTSGSTRKNLVPPKHYTDVKIVSILYCIFLYYYIHN